MKKFQRQICIKDTVVTQYFSLPLGHQGTSETPQHFLIPVKMFFALRPLFNQGSLKINAVLPKIPGKNSSIIMSNKQQWQMVNVDNNWKAITQVST